MENNKEYEIIGHITYPWCEEIRNLLFYKSNATTYNIYRNGILITSKRYKKSIVDFIVKNGPYNAIEEKNIRWHGQKSICGLPVGVLRTPHKGKTKAAYIFVKAGSLTELVKNSEIIYNYVKDATGIEGEKDIFTMMEECK